jgi:hypothetical protein
MVLPHRKNMSPHPDTLCSFRASQCFLVHFNLAFLAKKQHIRMCLVFGFTPLWLEPTTYLTRSDHTNHYTPDSVYCLIFYLNLLRIIVNIYPIYLKEDFEDISSINPKTDNTIWRNL